MKISPELIDFLKEKILIAQDKNISPSTRLEEDLWLSGDEAAEVLYQFSGQFGVNIDELDFFKYFSKEKEWYYYFQKLASLLIPSLIKKNKKESTLTVEDLERSIHTKILK